MSSACNWQHCKNFIFQLSKNIFYVLRTIFIFVKINKYLKNYDYFYNLQKFKTTEIIAGGKLLAILQELLQRFNDFQRLFESCNSQ